MKKSLGVLAVLGLLCFAAGALLTLQHALSSASHFDDSFMFYRYATNMRHGLGMSWNLDGVHTYGETAPLWGLIVFALSFLPLSAATVLVLGSWICAVGTLAAITWAVVRSAQSDVLKNVAVAAGLIAIPLIISPVFRSNAVTGMETMFAAMLLAIFAGSAVSWCRDGSSYGWMALAGLALFLTRPESALAVVLLPALFVLLEHADRRGYVFFLVLFLAGVCCDLAFCRYYFHTALPLSFYMKSGHAYEGYVRSWHPLGEAARMLFWSWPFFAMIALFGRRSDARLIWSFAIPTVLTFGYLATVTQIMGFDSRYYVPYLPFFAIPAFLVLDRFLASGKGWAIHLQLPSHLLARTGFVCAFGLLLAVLASHRGYILLAGLDRRIEGRPFLYDPVRLNNSATQALPRAEWIENTNAVANLLVAPLPAGSTIAASEVGYLGVVNPSINVIDLEGLNDPQIALHGFNAANLIARKPDMILMPHDDYTWQRGMLLTDPSLLAQYDVYAGAADYTLAIRKDSACSALLNRQLEVYWRRQYAGYRMSDYLVRSASWTGAKSRATARQREGVTSGD